MKNILHFMLAFVAAFTTMQLVTSAVPQVSQLQLACPGAANFTGRITTVGQKCTSSSTIDDAKKQEAVDDANNALLAAYGENSYVCENCPSAPPAPCEKSHSLNPAGYTMADCTFNSPPYPSCQGNPLKKLIIATCVQSFAVVRQCNDC